MALGDSSTEGLDDPDGSGHFRGWADRLAEHIAIHNPGLEYANLAVRGRSAGEIAATQLAPALAMQPDLATVVAGMNDLLRRNFDAVRVAGHVGEMVRGLIGVGATVVTFTIPDVSGRMRLGTTLTARTDALNRELRRLAQESGAILLDLANYALAYDERMWARDRIHGNSAGHAAIGNELAHVLGVPGAIPGSLAATLEPPSPRRRRDLLVEDLRWVRLYVLPWAWRRLRGRTTGDGITAKRPTPRVIVPRDPARP
ncbi:MAG: SGNH/GDSL hydrolase family protein [Kofleriaceae bacterium]|nr:SGNH/GDSL hydrolase family protein [Kofleriaceae bacterium]